MYVCNLERREKDEILLMQREAAVIRHTGGRLGFIFYTTYTTRIHLRRREGGEEEATTTRKKKLIVNNNKI